MLLFLAAFGLVAWAVHVAITGRIPTWSRLLYFAALTGSVIAAYFTTFHYTYLANANTRIHGWPVPTVVFQRDGLGKPWLDFVGPTVILAYPMNLVLFAFVPALMVLVVFWIREHPQMTSIDATAPTEAQSVNKQGISDSTNPYHPPLDT
ncbi:membrane protein [Rhodopirellula sallentina SM41]|uniref:Membrane protein n=2 Tax=Rhodopirellula TaxID=265488 RepID=M5TTR8_9BACT|nr:membrane protein [Rhodopirellula sallentina SM41]